MLTPSAEVAMTGRTLDGQVAVVTGGGKGIGRAIALELAALGARVLVTGREERALAEVVGEIAFGGGQARHLAGDVRRAEHLHSAVERATGTWGRLDIAVANAGATATVKLGEAARDPEAAARARAVVETNLLGTWNLFDAAAAAMAGAGRLVAISSVLAKFGAAGQGAYCASKAGVHGLVRAAALELAPRGITCNAVCPGWVDTEMAQARIAQLAGEAHVGVDEMKRRAAHDVPLGRFVQPEEVAKLVAFLCSPAGAAITGQALSVCGGATAFGS